MFRRHSTPVPLMSQHFLLSSAARTFSLMALCQLSDEDAYNMFRRLRWPDNDGAPVCPGCDCSVAYVYRCRRLYKCKRCHRQFSVTSGTLFASRKLPFQVLLLAIGLFINAAKGISSLQTSRDLDIHAKTAFVLLHKFRCALLSNTSTIALSGVVEIDGAWFGGHIRPRNHRAERIDRRRRKYQNGKRRCVVVMRQRGGPTVPIVTTREAGICVSHPTTRRRGQHGPCRRSECLGRPARMARDAADQPSARLQREWSLHQSGGKLLFPSPPRRTRPASSYRRPLPGPVFQRNGLA